MVVLFITHYADFYGANRSLLAMMIHLRKEHGVIPVVLINRKGDFIEELNKQNIPYVKSFFYMCKIENTQVRKRIHICLRKCITPYLYYRAKKVIRRYGEISIIHSNSSVIDVGVYLSSKLQIPHIWHIREFGLEDYGLEDIYSKKNINKKMNQAACNIAISESIKENVEKKYGSISVKVVYNGIDIIPRYTKTYFENEIVRFCVLGIIGEGKNQIEVLKACKYLKDRKTMNFLVTFIGSFIDENYQKKMEDFVLKNNLSDYVKFTGYIKEPQDILRGMDVGIISSKKEAFGRVTIEYMSNYMPVIGTNCGGTKELINTHNGVLYPGGEYKQLAKEMELIMNNKAMILKMGEDAREFAETMNAKENAKKIYEIYRLVEH